MTVQTIARGDTILIFAEQPPITVRPAEAGDAPALQRLWAEPQILANTSLMPYTRLQDIVAQIQNPQPGSTIFVACAGETLLGSLGLKGFSDPLRRHVAEICRVSVGAAWQGRGVASALLRAAIEYAEGWLNVTRIELLVRSDNRRAIGLYERHGFVLEGTLRGYGYRDGALMDVCAMARIRG